MTNGRPNRAVTFALQLGETRFEHAPHPSVVTVDIRLEPVDEPGVTGARVVVMGHQAIEHGGDEVAVDGQHHADILPDSHVTGWPVMRRVGL